MGDADSGVGGVDTLTALAGRAIDVDAEIGFVDLHFLDLVGLRIHENAGRGGMHASLRFGDRHPLHAMDATLELQPRPDAVERILGLDRQRRVLVATQVRDVRVENLDSPAAAFGVADVHPRQVGREERRLLAALT